MKPWTNILISAVIAVVLVASAQIEIASMRKLHHQNVEDLKAQIKFTKSALKNTESIIFDWHLGVVKRLNALDRKVNPQDWETVTNISVFRKHDPQTQSISGIIYSGPALRNNLQQTPEETSRSTNTSN